MKLWYYWFEFILWPGEFDRATFADEREAKRHRAAAKDCRWVGPLRSVTIVKDKPKAKRKGGKK